MSKYTYTMALARINECHNRECQAGHWIAAGITGRLHADFMEHKRRPATTIPTVEDIRRQVTRYIRRVNPDDLIHMWVDESTSEWGIRQDLLGLPRIPVEYAQVSVVIYQDSSPGDICRYLIREMRYEVGITDVDDDHPLLRDLRAERDSKAVAAMRASQSD